MNDRRGPQFPTTQWSLVYRAGGADGTAEEPLSRLLARYIPALRGYLRLTKRLPTHEAEDALQDFLLEKVVRQQLIGQADARRGRFRTFLLTVLNRFLIDRYRAQRTQNRPAHLALDAVPEPTQDDPAVRAFETEWAQVLAPATDAAEPTCYEALVAELGLSSPAQASNLLMTGKRMFARNLRGVIQSYASNGDEVEEELADLARVLAKPAGDA